MTDIDEVVLEIEHVTEMTSELARALEELVNRPLEPLLARGIGPLQKTVENVQYALLVARRDGLVVGMVEMIIVPLLGGPYAQVVSLYVDNRRRSADHEAEAMIAVHVEKRLMERAASHAKRRGASNISITMRRARSQVLQENGFKIDEDRFSLTKWL